MLALNITDIKDFMNKLLLAEVFDPFWLTEVSVTTFNTFTIDGRLQREFFDSDSCQALDETARTHSLWKEVKPFCYSVIRGKHTPLHFKIIFQLPYSKAEAALSRTDLGISPDNVTGLYLNLQYKNNALLCTTGTSLKTFLPGRQVEQFWDNMILEFFRKKQIHFEEKQ